MSRTTILAGAVRTAACGVAMVLAAVAVAAETAAPRDYEQVIAARAEKIVAMLDRLNDDVRGRVREALLDFYRGTHAWHEAHGPRRKELRAAQDDTSKRELAALEGELAEIRDTFVSRLSSDLSPAEVEQVKDGLTYGVLHVTERAYHEMIELLTDDEKARIRAWLVEARDLAIAEGSSEAKHGVFGKYKGRINNYLSQQGYDLKQEERGWQARRKAAAARAKSEEAK